MDSIDSIDNIDNDDNTSPSFTIDYNNQLSFFDFPNNPSLLRPPPTAPYYNPLLPISPSPFNTNHNRNQDQNQLPFLDIDIHSVDPLQTITPQLNTYPDNSPFIRTSSEADVFNTSQSTSHITHPTHHLPSNNSLQVLFPPISPVTSLSDHHELKSTALSPSPSSTLATTSNPISSHHTSNPLSSITRPKSPKSKPMTHILSQDFRRRKEWHKRLVEDVMDVLQVIGPTGELLFVSDSMTRLTGFPTTTLLGNQISNWCYEEEDRLNLDREIKNCFNPGSSGIINFYCRFKKKDSPGYVIFEISGHLIQVKTNPGISRGETKNEKQVIIINARPYPTSCGRLTDEFLELMLENEAMMRVINSRVGVGTRDEAVGEISSSSSKALERASGSGTTQVKNEAVEGEGKKKKKNTEEPDETGEDDRHVVAKDSEAEDDLPLPLPAPLSLPPLDTSEATHRPRVRGPNKRERADFLCLDCGVTQSPEWRKGPMGRKTLCNACGLRYAKKAK